MRRKSPSRGFTLIELTIVIGIVVMTALIVVPAVEGAMGVKTREEAGKLAGAIRAMYGEAALSGKTCRLVLDIDKGEWWPECTEGQATIRRVEDSQRGSRVEDKVNQVFGSADEEAARKQVESRGTFSSYQAELSPKVELPERVKIDGVWTQHQTEVYTKGTAYLYFFPHGQTETAYLYLAEADGDDTYTVRVDPMTGRTHVDAQKISVPDRLVPR
jgi:general secretion pathway protein H